MSGVGAPNVAPDYDSDVEEIEIRQTKKQRSMVATLLDPVSPRAPRTIPSTAAAAAPLVAAPTPALPITKGTGTTTDSRKRKSEPAKRAPETLLKTMSVMVTGIFETPCVLEGIREGTLGCRVIWRGPLVPPRTLHLTSLRENPTAWNTYLQQLVVHNHWYDMGVAEREAKIEDMQKAMPALAGREVCLATDIEDAQVEFQDFGAPSNQLWTRLGSSTLEKWASPNQVSARHVHDCLAEADRQSTRSLFWLHDWWRVLAPSRIVAKTIDGPAFYLASPMSLRWTYVPEFSRVRCESLCSASVAVARRHASLPAASSSSSSTAATDAAAAAAVAAAPSDTAGANNTEPVFYVLPPLPRVESGKESDGHVSDSDARIWIADYGGERFDPRNDTGRMHPLTASLSDRLKLVPLERATRERFQSILASLEWSVLKSLLQKWIRFRPAFVTLDSTEKYPAESLLLELLRHMVGHRGGFHPELGEWNDGLGDVCKRLAVIGLEDTAAEMPEVHFLLVMAALCKWHRNASNWRPAVHHIERVLELGIIFYRRTQCYAYRTDIPSPTCDIQSLYAPVGGDKTASLGGLLSPRADQVSGACSALLDRLGSFDGDKRMFRWLAQELVRQKPHAETDFTEGFHLSRALDQHCCPTELAYALVLEFYTRYPSTTKPSLPAAAAFHEVFHQVTGHNPRRHGPLESKKDVGFALTAVHTAQRRIWNSWFPTHRFDLTCSLNHHHRPATR